MASIERYETQAGPRYMVRYRKPDRRQAAKKGFKTKRDARLWASTVEVDKATGTYIDPKAGRTTIRTLGEEWTAGLVHVKPQTLVAYDVSLRNHVLPEFGDMGVASVTAPMIRTWVAGMSKRYKAPTVRRAYRVLSTVLDLAVSGRMIPANPAREVRGLPTVARRRNVYLTYQQVELLAEHAGPYRLPIYLAAYCGLRWGEIMALTVGDVDLSGHVRVRHTLTQAGALSTPKNGQERTVGFPAFLRPLLREAVVAAEERLFQGLALPRTAFGWWKDAKAAAGLSEALTFHDLRHSCASFAVASGASVKTIQGMLGHASAAVTLDTYADILATDMDAVAVRIEEARRVALG